MNRRGRAAEAPPVARVVPVPAPPGIEWLDYRLPGRLRHVAAGTRVLVPVGARRRMGVVIATDPADPHPGELREVLAVLDETPILAGPLLELLQWVASYYLSPLSEVLAAALPAPLRVQTEAVAVAVPPWLGELARAGGPGALLAERGAVPLEEVRALYGAAGLRRLRKWAAAGWIAIDERLREPRVSTRRVRFFHARAGGPQGELRRRPALRAVYEHLRSRPGAEAREDELRPLFPRAAAKLAALVRMGLVDVREEEAYRTPPVEEAGQAVAVRLTAAQEDAVAAVAPEVARAFRAWLLRGVTGSGKTEVYLRLAAAARERGAGTLLLVPEISLTHQLVRRVREHFGERVAVLHSQLGAGERWDEWRRISRSEVDVVVGARSAVFAPVPRLGLIVVDEEHDPAYKQAESPRYHGRDVAVMRARLTGCPVVLGSATPSLESWHNARTGRYRLLELPRRVGRRPLPRVELVDLREEPKGAARPLSDALLSALRANFIAGGQSLVFLNRRGFSSFLQCNACGEMLLCAQCAVTLTWHRSAGVLRCHYCDQTIRRPRLCPACGHQALEPWGAGTEQIEACLQAALPGARVARLDRDTSRRKGAQARLLARWARGEIDVLAGTQMIAKGHDVPGVTLVGVVLGEAGLGFPDFRAAERTFQMLAQVAGRAGRGERHGRVLVQTRRPEHPALRCAAEHDYDTFAEGELAQRRELGYPPYSRLVMVRCEGPDPAATAEWARRTAQSLRSRAQGRWQVLGPAPAPLERLRGRFRWQILLRGRDGRPLRIAAGAVLAEIGAPARRADVRISADVDPVDMM